MQLKHLKELRERQIFSRLGHKIIWMIYLQRFSKNQYMKKQETK